MIEYKYRFTGGADPFIYIDFPAPKNDEIASVINTLAKSHRVFFSNGAYNQREAGLRIGMFRECSCLIGLVTDPNRLNIFPFTSVTSDKQVVLVLVGSSDQFVLSDALRGENVTVLYGLDGLIDTLCSLPPVRKCSKSAPAQTDDVLSSEAQIPAADSSVQEQAVIGYRADAFGNADESDGDASTDCTDNVNASDSSCTLNDDCYVETESDEADSSSDDPYTETESDEADACSDEIREMYYEGGNYSGTVENDLPHGTGRLEFDGIVYEGGFVRGRRTGTGTIRFPSGDTYSGTFVDGNMTGYGKITPTRSDSIFDWSADSGIIEYEGDVLAGRPHGSGTALYSDGSSRSGRWIYGRLTEND